MKNAIFVFGVAAVLASCADQRSFMGVPISASDIKRNPCEWGQQEDAQCYRNMPLGVLANLARIGEKEAQLELGIRFDEGRGVCQDRYIARDLYQLAAQDSPRKRTSFIPAGGTVRAVTTSAGVDKGLPKARKKLDELKTKPFGIIYAEGSPCASTNRGKK